MTLHVGNAASFSHVCSFGLFYICIYHLVLWQSDKAQSAIKLPIVIRVCVAHSQFKAHILCAKLTNICKIRPFEDIWQLENSALFCSLGTSSPVVLSICKFIETGGLMVFYVYRKPFSLILTSGFKSTVLNFVPHSWFWQKKRSQIVYVYSFLFLLLFQIAT